MASGAPSVEVKALFSGRAMLMIDDQPTVLKVGQTVSEVTLLGATSKQAILDVSGKRYTLAVSKRISASYEAAKTVDVYLQPDDNGHYLTPARINNRSVEVLVDTGATAVVMSLPQAKALGLDYRNGVKTSMQTASGVEQAYSVMLNSVSVGAITVNNVEAMVNMGDYPTIILLGNTFLNQVELSRKNGVLELQAQY